jgi:hypothetical protein
MDSMVSALRRRRSGAATGPFAIACVLGLTALPTGASHPERDGITLLPLNIIATLGRLPVPLSSPGTATAQQAAQASAAAALVSVDPRRSLIVTDVTLLRDNFPILSVLNALAAGSPNSMIARQLYDQWMDLQNPKPGIGQGGHCNDELTAGVATLNGFQFDCPRVEGQLVGTNPTDGNPNSFQPIAVVNRFDLATDPRTGGTDCGEYRIIYGKTSGMTVSTNRMHIIFEAVLPNPAPNGRDLTGCRPVAQFWADLSLVSDRAERARRMKTFFFTGLPGFAPVVKAAHYGFATPKATGQIRTNMFMQQNWVLREFRLTLVNARLKMVARPDTLSPAGRLFNERDAHPKGTEFRTRFLDAVPGLAKNDINTFNHNTLPATFDAGDGDQQNQTKSNYPPQFATSPQFSSAIQRKLLTVGSLLTPQQIVERSLAMSCAGCHQWSNGKNLGGGLVWPSSLQFSHVSEVLRETGPDGQPRFRISQGLNDVFLPRRKKVLETFLNGQ